MSKLVDVLPNTIGQIRGGQIGDDGMRGLIKLVYDVVNGARLAVCMYWCRRLAQIKSFLQKLVYGFVFIARSGVLFGSGGGGRAEQIGLADIVVFLVDVELDGARRLIIIRVHQRVGGLEEARGVGRGRQLVVQVEHGVAELEQELEDVEARFAQVYL